MPFLTVFRILLAAARRCETTGAMLSYSPNATRCLIGVSLRRRCDVCITGVASVVSCYSYTGATWRCVLERGHYWVTLWLRPVGAGSVACRRREGGRPSVVTTWNVHALLFFAGCLWWKRRLFRATSLLLTHFPPPVVWTGCAWRMPGVATAGMGTAFMPFPCLPFPVVLYALVYATAYAPQTGRLTFSCFPRAFRCT
jgi:hypothetical protein